MMDTKVEETRMSCEYNVESRVKLNPSWPDPLKATRSSTDIKWLVGFCIFLTVWFILAMHAYCADHTKETDQLGKNARGVIDPELNWSPQYMIYSFAVKHFGPSYSCPWHIVVGYIVLSGMVALLYMVMLWWQTIFIVYFAIFALLASLLTATVVLFIQDVKEEIRIWSYTWHFLFMFTAALLIFLTSKEEIPFACEVIKESSKIITWFPSLAIVPIVRLVLEAIVVALTTMVFIYIFRIPITSSSNQSLSFRLILYSLINFFGSLWLLFFIDDLIRMVLYGIYSNWYWTRYKSRIPKNTVINVAKLTFRYHLGTIALGSLVMTSFRFIQFLMQPLSRKILCVWRWRFPRKLFLGYLAMRLGFEVLIELATIVNPNAYIVCAFHGSNFLKSAKFAEYLLTKIDSNSILVVDRVNVAILCLGQLFAIGTSVAATYITCSKNEELEKNMFYVITIVVVGSFILTRAILCILSSAIDTLILCVVEDFKKNDGSKDQPYFMNFKLRILLVEARLRSLGLPV